MASNTTQSMFEFHLKKTSQKKYKSLCLKATRLLPRQSYPWAYLKEATPDQQKYFPLFNGLLRATVNSLGWMHLAVGMQPKHIKPCTQFLGSVYPVSWGAGRQICLQFFTLCCTVILLLLFDYIKKAAEFNNWCCSFSIKGSFWQSESSADVNQQHTGLLGGDDKEVLLLKSKNNYLFLLFSIMLPNQFWISHCLWWFPKCLGDDLEENSSKWAPFGSYSKSLTHTGMWQKVPTIWSSN